MYSSPLANAGVTFRKTTQMAQTWFAGISLSRDRSRLIPVSSDVSEEHIASIFRVEKINRARNQREFKWQARAFTLVSCPAYYLYPEDLGDMFLRNVT
jgi:hypothetical protein